MKKNSNGYRLFLFAFFSLFLIFFSCFFYFNEKNNFFNEEKRGNKQHGLSVSTFSPDNTSQTISRNYSSPNNHPGSGQHKGGTGKGSSEYQTTVVSSTPGETLLSFNLGNYSLDDFAYKGGVYAKVKASSDSVLLKQAGYPELPVFRENIILPASGNPVLEVRNVKMVEVASAIPFPSKGFISRSDLDKEPDLSIVNSLKGSFPEEIASLTDDFNIRKTRGVGVVVKPFSYNFTTGRLSVVTSCDISIRVENSDSFSELPVSRSYSELVESTFVNYVQVESVATRTATDLTEAMLIIVPDDWYDNVADFVTWKRSRGLEINVLKYPADTGQGNTSITTAIANDYAARNTTYVMLIGDSGDIPLSQTASIPSDMLYSRLEGDDYYHDVFMSRVSVSSAEAMQYQLSKFINYEKSPEVNGSWYNDTLMVASDEGAGKSEFGLDDYELLDLEVDKLTALNFDSITKVYEPNDDLADVTTSWNSGVSLIYYLGHGSTTDWATSGFSTSTASVLANNSRLPFVLNGNCLTGNFTYASGDCLAEAMMKTGDAINPAGACGVLSATTEMSWDPPIVQLQAFTGYMGSSEQFTAGEMQFADDVTRNGAGLLSYYSIQRAMDYCYSAEGANSSSEAVKIMTQVHLFGDSSLDLRISQPEDCAVSADQYIFTGTDYQVQVEDSQQNPMPGLTVCLYYDTIQLVGVTDANGGVVFNTDSFSEVTINTQVKLTVYSPEIVPYVTDVTIAGTELVIYEYDYPANVYAGDNYSYQFKAFTAALPVAWSVDENCPDYLTINETDGTLSGNFPETELTNPDFNVTVTDTDGDTDSVNVKISIGERVSLNAYTVPDVDVGGTLTYSFSYTGGFAPIVFETVGDVPNGLTVSEAGVLTWSPTVSGEYQFELKVSDSNGGYITETVAVTVLPSDLVTIDDSATLTQATRNVNYSCQLNASGGTGQFTWSLLSGSLPSGFSLSPSGLLSGSCDQEGDYSFVIMVTDNDEMPHVTQKEFSLEVYSPIYAVLNDVPDIYINDNLSYQLSAGGTDAGEFTYTLQQEVEYNYVFEDNDFSIVGEKQAWYSDDAEDDRECTYDLNFSFSYFGVNYDQLIIGDNGYVSFESIENSWDAQAVRLGQYKIIAPFWTDLVILDGHGGIYISEEENQVTITWNGTNYYFDDEWLSFSVTLYSSGDITFKYGDVTTIDDVVIGLGNADDNTAIKLANHLYSNGTYFEGWSQHDNVCFTVSGLGIDWLSISSAGMLSGTTDAGGEYTFIVKISDAENNFIEQEITITVIDMYDRNGDGITDDEEVMQAVEDWKAGRFTRAVMELVLEKWQTDESVSQTRSTAELPPAGRARTGDITIIELTYSTKSELNSLVYNYDVAKVDRNVVTIYADQIDLDVLSSQYELTVVDDDDRSYTYKSYADVLVELQAFATSYPDLCKYEVVGQTVLGRDIAVLKISDNVASDEQEPEIKIVAAMHGDEKVSKLACAKFIEFLLTNYSLETEDGLRATALVDNSELWFMPVMNPDGWVANTRYNDNDIDLNRNFPDRIVDGFEFYYNESQPDVTSREPETAAFMNWVAGRNFVLGASLHSGSLVVCYPYGNNETYANTVTPSPDDDVYKYISNTYVANHDDQMSGYLSSSDGGIINGADWYPVVGELTDWCYRYKGILDVTVEVSSIKSPGDPETVAQKHIKALLAYCETVFTGIKGTVKDTSSQPLEAIVALNDNENVSIADEYGAFYRILTPGDYQLNFSSSGYSSKSRTWAVSADSQRDVEVELLDGIQNSLVRIFPVEKFTPGQTYTVNLQVNIPALPDVYMVKEVCPDAWGAMEQVTSGLASPLLKQSGNTLTWLYWDAIAESDTLNYELETIGDLPQQFTGYMLFSDSSTLAVTEQVAWNSIGQVLTIENGWNLISLHYQATDMSADSVFPGYSAYYWDSKIYRNVTEYDTLTGYWLYSDQQQEVVTVEGDFTTTSLELKAGWNLVGVSQNTGLNELPDYVKSVWCWESEAYVAPEILTPGKGYWIYCSGL